MNNSKLTKFAVGAGVGMLAFKTLNDRHHIVSDVNFIRRFASVERRMATKKAMGGGYTAADYFEETCDVNPSKTALIFTEDDRSFTFGELDERANQVAHWAINKGFKPGDVVALFVENRPEFVIVELGLFKAGILVALINTNNKAKPLSHSIEVGKAKAVIFGSELTENMATVAEEMIQQNIPMYSLVDQAHPSSPGFTHESLDEQLKGAPTSRPPKSARGGAGLNDTLGYIYTSGTTGLPKACVILNYKFISVSGAYAGFADVAESDIVYTVLPLYHSAGGMIGLGFMYYGCTLVLARKFSTSKFFQECGKYKATVTQYIGELARYLLNAPPNEFDRKHRVRAVIGNGLRGDIWEPFLDRFNIPEVVEFYGATEGNIAFLNWSKNRHGVGSVGKFGTLLKKVMNFRLVKHDVATEMPIRDPSTGFCIDCAAGEPGELLGWINPDRESSAFVGYTSEEASAKKILKDVFEKGDMYFRTGDLMRHDPDGFMYFVDRIGDTFRWKGENVSTGEVSSIVGTFPGILEANIYGVKVPGNEDGRACMAALVTEGNKLVDFEAFAKHLRDSLATYAMPQFLRFLPEMEITGTFKQRKVDFVKDGIDPSVVTDKLFVYDSSTKTYVPLDSAKYLSIVQGQSRL